MHRQNTQLCLRSWRGLTTPSGQSARDWQSSACDEAHRDQQDAQAGARTGHPASIAPHGLQANDRSLSDNTLLLPGKTVVGGALALISNLDRLASPRRAGGGPACSRQSGHGSACLARQRERQVQLYAVMHHLGRDPSALAAFEADQQGNRLNIMRSGE